MQITQTREESTEERLKRTIEELEEQKRRLATLLENLPGWPYHCKNDEDWTDDDSWVIKVDIDQRIAREITEYTLQELNGKGPLTYNDIIHPEDRGRVWRTVQDAVAKREPFVVEYRIRTKSGKEKVMWEKGQGIFGEDGSLLALEGFIMDVTDRAKALQDLQEQKRRLLTLLGNLPGCAYHCNNDEGWSEDFNWAEFFPAKYLELTGYGKDELEPWGPVTWNSLVAPEDCERVWTTIQKAVAKREPFIVEYRIRTKSGQTKVVWEKGRAVYDGDGKAVALEGFLMDVTELRQTQEALRRSHSVHIWRSLFETLGRGASAILYQAGEEAGSNTFDFIQSGWKPQDESEFIETLSQHLRQADLCDVVHLEVDRENARVRAKVRDNIETRYGREGSSNDCHFLRGFLAGLGRRFLDEPDLVCDEGSCQARGKDLCEFLVHPLFE